MTFQLHPQLSKDSIVIGQFYLCQLLLLNDSQYPWFVLVPMRDSITELYQLTEQDSQQVWLESKLLSVVIMELFDGDKLNVAMLGNMVPQLHLHHIVRFKNDPCWPKPIWGQLAMKAYLPEKAFNIKQRMQQKLPSEHFKAA